MKITVIGEAIEVDGVAVATLTERRTREREAFRDAMRDAPEIHCESGGPGSLDDGGWQEKFEDAEKEIAELEDDHAQFRGAISDAIEAIKNDYPAEALKILSNALD